MAKEIVVTQQGYEALVAELEDLKVRVRKEIAEKIKVARGYGDLSENAEYDAAKNEQAEVEAHIADLEAKLKIARVLDAAELDTSAVSVGTTVTVVDEDEDEETYAITGATEADPDAEPMRISDESPIGKGLLGKAVGEVADILLPNGATTHLTVLKIVRTHH